jgi:predicted nucleic acid-binding protein
LSNADLSKKVLAEDWVAHLWESRLGRTSFQVLQELYSTLTRKLAHSVDRGVARGAIRELFSWAPVVIGAGAMDAAFGIQDRYRVSFWDSLIVSAARATRSAFLLTEDLQDGQDFDGLVVVNPFRHPPDSI